MGKERSRVNYCVSGNTSVSRCHARITRKGAQTSIPTRQEVDALL